MMFIVMSLMALLFTLTVVYIAKAIILYFEEIFDAKVEIAKKRFENHLKKLERVREQKKPLEREADKIFTLYDMTKEITQQLSRQEAFNVFKLKLKKTVNLRDCHFLDVDADELKNIEESAEQFIFELKSTKRKMGYLVFQGVAAQDKEKVMILSHQFALAMRRVVLYQEVEKLSITDSLTTLHTRRYFRDRLQEEIKRSENKGFMLSLLMVDVDNFKQFNDDYGHLTGDQVLKEAGKIINENIREIDIAGRFGGEEFCVMLPETDSHGAQLAGERIRSSVEKAVIKAYDETVKITVSIGLATFPQDEKTTDALMDKADWALYRAKKRGRNCVCAFGIYAS